MTSYLRFLELDLNTAIVSDGVPHDGVLPRAVKPRKTKIWAVMNDSNEELGDIRWYGPWRQYCYFQKPEIIMSEGCLREIVDFIKARMEERKNAKRKLSVIGAELSKRTDQLVIASTE